MCTTCTYRAYIEPYEAMLLLRDTVVHGVVGLSACFVTRSSTVTTICPTGIAPYAWLLPRNSRFSPTFQSFFPCKAPHLTSPWKRVAAVPSGCASTFRPSPRIMPSARIRRCGSNNAYGWLVLAMVCLSGSAGGQEIDTKDCTHLGPAFGAHYSNHFQRCSAHCTHVHVV
jgi:hypothetical protein